MGTIPLKTPRMLLIEANDPHGRKIEQIIADLIKEYGSQRAAAKRLNVTNTALSQWMYRLGISAHGARQ